ncbi:MAG TPA: methyltransferase domain-containing protein [Nitrospirae bacterium]|nr:16S ribosomal RNA methyltransferase KsgA/Dim1 family protein [bacterium BMS3Abin10]GBE37584.1 16S ribosomal RNA methyltransferase KsgA/Dim1 family protein [bacterium BMS3Bbin08]HDH51581.1 methyltransferase domain-containing protein [Nitrospirota bacterium]HDK81877.1 methyltransferase domain-containing protein [Nitrospirota bacterium]HDO25696.1 methyltransferase domain-containing protein [Nitrospirota bacterium]
MVHKWDKKRSEWYRRAVEQSDYPQKAVALLKPMLRTCDSVIDIGAGCGALSLPVARKVKKVTAVEPSKWMYDLLLKRAEKAGIKNIRAYNAGWKRSGLKGELPSAIKPHDMVICANLPYSVVCGRGFLDYISKISKKYIVYLHGAGRWNRFYYDDLYPMLFKKKYLGEGDYLNTYEFLHRRGIFADIRIFEFSFDQPFVDFNDALDFWRHRLKTKLTIKKEKILADFLKKKLVPSARASALTAPFGLRKAALMWWRP